MRFLVTGDVHGNIKGLKNVIKKHLDISNHLNTGDNANSTSELVNNNIIFVRGNNDYLLATPVVRIFNLDNLKIMLTHGHLQNVKNGLLELIKEAQKKSVDICIFGHTHQRLDAVYCGIRFLNPGALLLGEYLIYDNGKVFFYGT